MVYGGARLRVLCLVPEDSIPPRSLSGHTKKEIAVWRMEFDIAGALRRRGHDVSFLEARGDIGAIRDAVAEGKPHVVFNMLEEFLGLVAFEQHVAALLDLLGVPYTGCNPRGLMTARDKALTKRILAHDGIPVPGFAVYPRGRRVRPVPRLAYPLLVKSLTEEASLGIAHASLVRDDARLAERVAFVHDHVGSDAIAEEYVAGRELSLSLLGNRRVASFPPWELDLGHLPPRAPGFATSRVKWDVTYQQRWRIVSRRARLAPATERRIARLARRAYRLLGLSGYARIDLRLRDDGEVFLLEANPNPDLSRGDDFARAAAAGGLGYDDLIERILALGRAGRAWYQWA
jgi:D-alanine-D-alanine ligase